MKNPKNFSTIKTMFYYTRKKKNCNPAFCDRQKREIGNIIHNVRACLPQGAVS